MWPLRPCHRLRDVLIGVRSLSISSQHNVPHRTWLMDLKLEEPPSAKNEPRHIEFRSVTDKFRSTCFLQQREYADNMFNRKKHKAVPPPSPPSADLTSLSSQELINLATDLTSDSGLNKNRANIKVWKQLEKELCNRVNILTTPQILYLADCAYESNYLASTFLCRFAFKLQSTEIKNEVKHTELLQLLFYFSIVRFTPQNFLLTCEDAILRHIDLYSASELSILCYSYFVCNASFTSFSILEKLGARTLELLEEMSIFQLSNILKTMRHAAYKNNEFYEKVGNHLCNQSFYDLKSISILMHLVYPYASVKMSHNRLFDHITQHICDNLNNLQYRNKDLLKVLWSCAILQHPVPEDLVSAAMASMRGGQSEQWYRKHREVFVEGLMTLGFLGHYPMDLLSKALANNTGKSSKLIELCHFTVVFLVDSAKPQNNN